MVIRLNTSRMTSAWVVNLNQGNERKENIIRGSRSLISRLVYQFWAHLIWARAQINVGENVYWSCLKITIFSKFLQPGASEPRGSGDGCPLLFVPRGQRGQECPYFEGIILDKVQDFTSEERFYDLKIFLDLLKRFSWKFCLRIAVNSKNMGILDTFHC